MLGGVDARGERVVRVAGFDGHARLREDRAAVHLGRHAMHGAAGFLHARGQNLFMMDAKNYAIAAT